MPDIRRCPGPVHVAPTTAPELTSTAILTWWQGHRVEWHYILPGKPQQNAFAESFVDGCAMNA